ncbi:chromo domain-like protein [Cercophora newfieldiana]|uniref:Chromatin modification-related protein EAF3 n=1 Tax=Cercophora newfieldiana TaxID=92897 RepID=A0AA40CIA1_9PEZI|nr:chromo domain-like protein [Cercophora newfieldiana]
MAPKQQPPQAPFSKEERVLCFHMEMLYEAKILDVQPGENGEGWQYKIHYKGWKASWDDWVPQDRVRKFTDENKELAAQLRAQSNTLKAAKQPAKKLQGTGRGAGGSDMSSARGSEERTAAGGAVTQSGRGPRRARDFDLENVSRSPPDTPFLSVLVACVAVSLRSVLPSLLLQPLLVVAAVLCLGDGGLVSGKWPRR